MRFANLIVGAALAAAPALSQTTPQTTAPGATPTTAPVTPDMGAAPATPAGITPTAATPESSAQVVQPTVGATVLDPSGATVGTIKSIDAQYVTLTTDKGEARLPVNGVGPGKGGAVVGLTKAQLDAAVAQAKAAEPAAKTTTTTKTTTTKKR